jgi:hypothetical protein
MVLGRYRAIAAITVLLGAAAAISVDVAVRPTGRNFGQLSGYVWESGPVRSIGARWRVPTVLGGADGAQAATWVGVQQAFGHSAPFVQVGTLENTPSYYQAFWSDTLHSFKPQYLGVVFPGDVVVARIVSTPSGWRLTLDDLTAKNVETASSATGHGKPFGLGEWFEEDPTDLAGNVAALYPKLSTVGFQQLRLNDRSPPYGPLYSQWLSLPGGQYVAPTPLTEDHFSLRPASVSRAGAQYLGDVTPTNTAYGVFLAQSEDWTARTRPAEAAAQAATFARAARTQDGLLAQQGWPHDLHPEIVKAIDDQQPVIADLGMVGKLASAQRPAWLAHLKHDVQRHAQIGHLIRRALHIPEYVPS